jgi:hypothetical protein
LTQSPEGGSVNRPYHGSRGILSEAKDLAFGRATFFCYFLAARSAVERFLATKVFGLGMTAQSNGERLDRSVVW